MQQANASPINHVTFEVSTSQMPSNRENAMRMAYNSVTVKYAVCI
jgi:hypothetical protein